MAEITRVTDLKNRALSKLGLRGDPARPVTSAEWWEIVYDLELSILYNSPIDLIGELETDIETSIFSLENTTYTDTKRITMPSNIFAWFDFQVRLESDDGNQWRYAQIKDSSEFKRGVEAQNYYYKPKKTRPWICKIGKKLLIAPVTNETYLAINVHAIEKPDDITDDSAFLQVADIYRTIMPIYVASKVAPNFGLDALGIELRAEWEDEWEKITGKKWNAFRKRDYQLPLEPTELPRGRDNVGG